MAHVEFLSIPYSLIRSSNGRCVNWTISFVCIKTFFLGQFYFFTTISFVEIRKALAICNFCLGNIAYSVILLIFSSSASLQFVSYFDVWKINNFACCISHDLECISTLILINHSHCSSLCYCNPIAYGVRTFVSIKTIVDSDDLMENGRFLLRDLANRD